MNLNKRFRFRQEVIIVLWIFSEFRISSAGDKKEGSTSERRYACWGSFGPPVVSAQCPRDTVIQVLRAGLKVQSHGGLCKYSEKDCGCEFGELGCNMPNVRALCMGQPACRLDVTQQYINTDSCRGFSDYMFIDFNCVPVQKNTILDMCSNKQDSVEAGFIRSPNYPRASQYKQQCECNLQTQPYSSISMTILDFHSEDVGCKHNRLSVDQGGNTNTYCGDRTGASQTIKPSSNKVVLNYDTDGAGPNGGFWLKYEATPKATIKIDCKVQKRSKPVVKKPPTTTTPEPRLVENNKNSFKILNKKKRPDDNQDENEIRATRKMGKKDNKNTPWWWKFTIRTKTGAPTPTTTPKPGWYKVEATEMPKWIKRPIKKDSPKPNSGRPMSNRSPRVDSTSRLGSAPSNTLHDSTSSDQRSPMYMHQRPDGTHHRLAQHADTPKPEKTKDVEKVVSSKAQEYSYRPKENIHWRKKEDEEKSNPSHSSRQRDRWQAPRNKEEDKNKFYQVKTGRWSAKKNNDKLDRNTGERNLISWSPREKEKEAQGLSSKTKGQNAKEIWAPSPQHSKPEGREADLTSYSNDLRDTTSLNQNEARDKKQSKYQIYDEKTRAWLPVSKESEKEIDESWGKGSQNRDKEIEYSTQENRRKPWLSRKGQLPSDQETISRGGAPYPERQGQWRSSSRTGESRPGISRASGGDPVNSGRYLGHSGRTASDADDRKSRNSLNNGKRLYNRNNRYWNHDDSDDNDKFLSETNDLEKSNRKPHPRNYVKERFKEKFRYEPRSFYPHSPDTSDEDRSTDSGNYKQKLSKIRSKIKEKIKQRSFNGKVDNEKKYPLLEKLKEKNSKLTQEELKAKIIKTMRKNRKMSADKTNVASDGSVVRVADNGMVAGAARLKAGQTLQASSVPGVRVASSPYLGVRGPAHPEVKGHRSGTDSRPGAGQPPQRAGAGLKANHLSSSSHSSPSSHGGGGASSPFSPSSHGGGGASAAAVHDRGSDQSPAPVQSTDKVNHPRNSVRQPNPAYGGKGLMTERKSDNSLQPPGGPKESMTVTIVAACVIGSILLIIIIGIVVRFVINRADPQFAMRQHHKKECVMRRNAQMQRKGQSGQAKAHVHK